MKKWSIWHWFVCIALVVIALIFIIGLTKAIGEKGMGSAEAAAWMQAVGAFGAIFAAFAISHRQHLEDQRNQRHGPLLSLRSIMDRAHYLIYLAPSTRSEVSSLMVHKFADEVDLRPYQDILEVLREYPAHSLQDYQAIQALLEMRGAMAVMLDLVSVIDRYTAMSISDTNDTETRCQFVIDQLFPFEECQDRADKAMTYLQVALDGAGVN